MVTIPTGGDLVEGFEAFGFGGLAALGLRTSLFDFFWPLAMMFPLAAGDRGLATLGSQRNSGADEPPDG